MIDSSVHIRDLEKLKFVMMVWFQATQSASKTSKVVRSDSKITILFLLPSLIHSVVFIVIIGIFSVLKRTLLKTSEIWAARLNSCSWNWMNTFFFLICWSRSNHQRKINSRKNSEDFPIFVGTTTTTTAATTATTAKNSKCAQQKFLCATNLFRD